MLRTFKEQLSAQKVQISAQNFLNKQKILISFYWFLASHTCHYVLIKMRNYYGPTSIACEVIPTHPSSPLVIRYLCLPFIIFANRPASIVVVTSIVPK